MLIKNTDENLVNGSMGRVRRFVDPMTYGIEDDVEALAEDGSSKSSSQASVQACEKECCCRNRTIVSRSRVCAAARGEA